MKKRILLVEDDSSIRNLVEILLKKRYKIITHKNGLEGILWLDEGNHPDLILTDLNMPEISGYEFLLNLKKSGFHRDIPVIVFSDQHNPELIIECLKAGAEDYIIKPFNPKELYEKVEKALTLTNYA